MTPPSSGTRWWKAPWAHRCRMTDATPAPDVFRAHWIGGVDLAVRALADEDERGAQFDRMLAEHVALALDDLGDVLAVTALNPAKLSTEKNIARREADRELLEYVRARATAIRDGAGSAPDLGSDEEEHGDSWCNA